MFTRLLGVAVVFVVAVTARAAPEAELQKAAKPLTDFAAWCGPRKAKSVGEAALEQAKAIIATPTDLAKAEAALAGAADDDAKSPAVADKRAAAYDSAAAALQTLAGRKHSADTDDEFDGYLIKAVELSPSAARMSALTAAMGRAVTKDRLEIATRMYVLVAMSEPPRKPYPIETRLAADGKLATTAETIVDAFVGREQYLQAAAFLTRLAMVDAKGFTAGSYQTAAGKVTEKHFLARATTHAMAAYVSIPKSWDPSRKSPIIFCFAGSGGEYESMCKGYRQAAEGFVVVSCATLSNRNAVSAENMKAYYPANVVAPYAGDKLSAGRLQFDLPGILAMYKLVHDAVNTEQQMYITGFSGGGIPCYGTMLGSPGLIAAAAPVAPNYYYPVPAGGRARAPVQIFLGAKDPHNDKIGTGSGLIEQTRAAITVLKQTGYTVAEPVMVPDVGHSAMHKQVTEFFEAVRKN